MTRSEAMAAVRARKAQEAAHMLKMQTCLQLSFADLERITLAAAGRGLSVQNLLERFITDCVCGTHADLKAAYEARKYLEEAYADLHNPEDYSLNFVRFLYDQGQLAAVLSDPDLGAKDPGEWKWFLTWNDYHGACAREHSPAESWEQARGHLAMAAETMQTIKTGKEANNDKANNDD